MVEVESGKGRAESGGGGGGLVPSRTRVPSDRCFIFFSGLMQHKTTMISSTGSILSLLTVPLVTIAALDRPIFSATARVKQHFHKTGQLIDGEEHLLKVIVKWDAISGAEGYELCHNCNHILEETGEENGDLDGKIFLTWFVYRRYQEAVVRSNTTDYEGHVSLDQDTRLLEAALGTLFHGLLVEDFFDKSPKISIFYSFRNISNFVHLYIPTSKVILRLSRTNQINTIFDCPDNTTLRCCGAPMTAGDIRAPPLHTIATTTSATTVVQYSSNHQLLFNQQFNPSS